MKNKRIDLNKSETQSGSFNKRQLIDFIKASNTCIGKDILIQHEYIEIIDVNNNIQKELNSKSICGTIEITQGKQEMKIDKTDLILQEIRNIKNDFNEFKVEVKDELKTIRNDIKDIKNCPTIKSELNISK
ncbi:hypothetical protein [Malacoplasma muris]|uniref:hypothetical protein n=1 Tax=Malacoplasma muris TaxID=2119 RepID=UPI00398F20D2